MGVFDPENSLSIESTPEVEPSTEDTSTVDGHVVEEKETQAPETTEETETQENETQEVKEESNESEESKESEVTQEDEEDKQQEPQKLYAGKFKTIGWLFNGINDAAGRLGETIDLNRINSIEDAEAYYKELQQRISRGEAKNYSRTEQKETNKAKNETLPQIEIELSEYEKNLAKIIEDSKAVLKQLETETVDDEDDEIFEARFAENPKKALAERDAKIVSRLEKKFEAMLNLKGAELGLTLAPILEGYRYWQDQVAGRDAWNQALSNMDAVLKEHGIDDFEKDLPAVLEIIKNDPQLIDLVNASPRDVKVRETVLRIAYRDLKSKAKEADLQKQLAEFAKATAEKDAQKIKDSKVGLKMQNGIGGAANSQPKKENDLVKIFGKRPESTGVFD